MDNTIQLYIDKNQEIKGYPITSSDRVDFLGYIMTVTNKHDNTRTQYYIMYGFKDNRKVSK